MLASTTATSDCDHGVSDVPHRRGRGPGPMSRPSSGPSTSESSACHTLLATVRAEQVRRAGPAGRSRAGYRRWRWAVLGSAVSPSSRARSSGSGPASHGRLRRSARQGEASWRTRCTGSSAAAAARGADLDPGGARRDGVRRRSRGCCATTSSSGPRCASRLIKDRRDEEVFDEIFDQFFALVKVGRDRHRARPRARPRRPLRRGRAGGLHAVRGAERDPAAGAQHGKPVDIRDFFDPDDLAQQYNLHQEANKIDLAAMTDEIVLSKDNQGIQGEGNRVQIETDRLHHAGMPGPDLPAAGHEGRRRPVGRPAGGAAGLAERRRRGVAGRHRGRRGRAAPAAHRRARRAARGDQEATSRR